MSRYPQLTLLVTQLRAEHPRPSLRWSELVERIRSSSAQEPRQPFTKIGASTTPK